MNEAEANKVVDYETSEKIETDTETREQYHKVVQSFQRMIKVGNVNRKQDRDKILPSFVEIIKHMQHVTKQAARKA